MLRSTGSSRGTGPRATVSGRSLGRRTAPRTVWRGPVPRHANCTIFTGGRGPVPRHTSVYRKFAGDRPPRYGSGRIPWQKNGPPHRMARACPSPRQLHHFHRRAVGKPVPRHAALYRKFAGDRPPRECGSGRIAWQKNSPLTGGRWENLFLAMY